MATPSSAPACPSAAARCEPAELDDASAAGSPRGRSTRAAARARPARCRRRASSQPCPPGSRPQRCSRATAASRAPSPAPTTRPIAGAVVAMLVVREDLPGGEEHYLAGVTGADGRYAHRGRAGRARRDQGLRARHDLRLAAARDGGRQRSPRATSGCRSRRSRCRRSPTPRCAGRRRAGALDGRPGSRAGSQLHARRQRRLGSRRSSWPPRPAARSPGAGAAPSPPRA